MTDRELLQQALDALEKHVHEYETIQAIKTRLEPPKKEWVGLTYADLYFWGGELGLGELGKGVLRAVDAHLREKNSGYSSTKKEWVGLTDEEVKILATQGRTDFSRPAYNEFYSAIAQALKEKNT